MVVSLKTKLVRRLQYCDIVYFGRQNGTMSRILAWGYTLLGGEGEYLAVSAPNWFVDYMTTTSENKRR